MLQTLADTLLPPLLARAVLALNHVLRSQPVATERLVAHTGRTVDIVWRAPANAWPVPPALRLSITRAGLVELEDASLQQDLPAASLVVRVDLPPPHKLVAMSLAGERPSVDVEGDAQFAADVAWLADNVRWDAEHDLARVIGNGPAHWLTQVARAAAQPLRRLARGIGTATATWERRRGVGAQSPQ